MCEMDYVFVCIWAILSTFYTQVHLVNIIFNLSDPTITNLYVHISL